jgi:hypothetical protein
MEFVSPPRLKPVRLPRIRGAVSVTLFWAAKVPVVRMVDCTDPSVAVATGTLTKTVVFDSRDPALVVQK